MYSIRSEGSIVAADTPFVTAMQRTAVVADPDAGRLESSAAALRAAGYVVHTALDAEALFSRSEEHTSELQSLAGSRMPSSA